MRLLSIIEWLCERCRLRAMRVADIDKKLAVIRAAAKHEYPVDDIDVMLGEIEKG